MLRAAIILFLTSSTAAAWAQQALPRLPRDMDYAEARRTLLAQGWRPVRLPDASRCPTGDERCAGRPEMLACAGTGLAACVFTWRRGSTVVEVHTVGEGHVGVSRLRCRSNCR